VSIPNTLIPIATGSTYFRHVSDRDLRLGRISERLPALAMLESVVKVVVRGSWPWFNLIQHYLQGLTIEALDHGFGRTGIEIVWEQEGNFVACRAADGTFERFEGK
jgi:hypothetical protein